MACYTKVRSIYRSVEEISLNTGGNKETRCNIKLRKTDRVTLT